MAGDWRVAIEEALTRAVQQIEKSFGKEVTTRTWETLEKVMKVADQE